MVRASSRNSALRGVRILIIDGDAKIANLMKDVLEKLGFSNIHTATDGFEGVKKIKDNQVDFVITDWELRPSAQHLGVIPENAVIKGRNDDFPPINGASFVKSLRHSPSSPNPFVPVVMMVSKAMKDLVMLARDSGVNEILLKPIIAEDLCDRIVRLIDDPRPFVTSKGFKGPCRRRSGDAPPAGVADRRKLHIQLIEYDPVVHHV